MKIPDRPDVAFESNCSSQFASNSPQRERTLTVTVNIYKSAEQPTLEKMARENYLNSNQDILFKCHYLSGKTCIVILQRTVQFQAFEKSNLYATADM